MHTFVYTCTYYTGIFEYASGGGLFVGNHLLVGLTGIQKRTNHIGSRGLRQGWLFENKSFLWFPVQTTNPPRQMMAFLVVSLKATKKGVPSKKDDTRIERAKEAGNISGVSGVGNSTGYAAARRELVTLASQWLQPFHLQLEPRVLGE